MTAKKKSSHTPTETPIRRDYLPKEKRRGQDGPRLSLSPSDLNDKESKVYAFLVPGSKLTLDELAEVFSRSTVKDRRKSWVRNSLRRLIRGRLVRKVDEGTYERAKK